MIKSRLKDYAPIILMLVCAAAVGALLASGVLDIERIPDIVSDNPWLAIAVIMALYLLKGFSGVILYNALVVMVSMVFELWEALLINGAGTAVTLSVSYIIGKRTETSRIHSKLEKHQKILKYFDKAQQYGFVFCFAIHLAGLNMEVLGLIFGMLRIGFWRYLASSWLAVIPGMICFTIMGNTLDIRSEGFWIVLAVDVLLISFGLWYTRRKLKETERLDNRQNILDNDPS